MALAAVGFSRRSFAVLAHRWARGGIVEQGEVRTSPLVGQRQKQRVVVVLHGILGSKANWNTPVKRLLERVGHLGWRALQIDHRAHGASPSGEGPHTVEACAADVLDTLVEAGVCPIEDELVLCGHSFGGKVALSFTRAQLEAGRPPPRITWLLDSVPGRKSDHRFDKQEEDNQHKHSVGFVVSAVEAASAEGAYSSRRLLIEALVSKHGLTAPLAQWVGQSVRSLPCGTGVEFTYDVQVVRALYDAYRRTDYWNFLEDRRASVGIVVAGRHGGAWRPDDLEKLGRCGSHVHVATLKDAGHNVHVDDLPGLLDILEPSFA
eukprot:TRINITY_DN45077_c0_g1_i1.p1 TRINITY_DN45077_c0_g1~~TRINITY_DN45077_c0_g1_i1.p1  ORF type:complete len:320 (+),score=39.92 TRINITY_DN45077_c0_g1_i1:95-1054(+)